jgi:hypothetical protein
MEDSDLFPNLPFELVLKIFKYSPIISPSSVLVKNINRTISIDHNNPILLSLCFFCRCPCYWILSKKVINIETDFENFGLYISIFCRYVTCKDCMLNSTWVNSIE